MKKSTKIILIIIFSTILIMLSGCNNNKEGELKEKVKQEIEYFDNKIISMINLLNNISLENYEVTSKEVEIKQSSQDSEFSGSSSGSEAQNAEKNTNQGNKNEQDSSKSGETVTLTEMKTDSTLTQEKKDIRWDLLKLDIELLSSAWSTVTVDLYSAKVSNDDILGFSTTIDKCIMSIKKEDKLQTLKKLAELYSYIPKYSKSISEGTNIQNIKDTQNYILKAYSIVENGDWTLVDENLSKAESTFSNVTNDIEYIKNREYKVNKTYILIKELRKSLIEKDIDVFYIKYKNLMESINTL